MNNIINEIISEFDLTRIMSDSAYKSDLKKMEDKELIELLPITQSKYAEDHFLLIPKLMILILKAYKPFEGLTVDNLVEDFAEYGKCKNADLNHLNFRLCCNKKQKLIVISFLEGLLYDSQYLLDSELMERVIKNWRQE